MDTSKIVQELTQHMAMCGGDYKEWYVGVTHDARSRLFRQHNVIENKDAWIYRKTASEEDARHIEKHCIETLGTDGGPGGGDNTANIVYAYRKSGHTNP